MLYIHYSLRWPRSQQYESFWKQRDAGCESMSGGDLASCQCCRCNLAAAAISASSCSVGWLTEGSRSSSAKIVPRATTEARSVADSRRLLQALWPRQLAPDAWQARSQTAVRPGDEVLESVTPEFLDALFESDHHVDRGFNRRHFTLLPYPQMCTRARRRSDRSSGSRYQSVQPCTCGPYSSRLTCATLSRACQRRPVMMPLA